MININEIMQIAVTPVFLLAGIGSILISLTNRLGRIKDRMRVLQRFALDYETSSENRIFERARLKLILATKMKPPFTGSKGCVGIMMDARYWF